jgi:hypothetical protein
VKERLDSIINLCVENIQLLAYQQLLAHFVSEFRTILGDPCPKILDKLLVKALSCVCVIVDVFKSTTLPVKASSSGTACAMRFDSGHTPKKIPVPEWASFSGTKTVDLGADKSKFKTLTQKCAKEAGKSDEDLLNENKKKAYFLLDTIKIMFEENCDWTIIEELQKKDNLKKLLLCGIGSDPTSMLSVRAFSLAELALDGVEEEFCGVRYKEGIPDLLEELSECMIFTEKPTPKMISGFPIFWNHRYKTLKDVHDYEVIRIELEGGGKHKTIEWKRPAGMTPLELYGRRLLDEPAYSDTLNNKIMKVLRYFENSTKELRNRCDKNKSLEDSESLLKKDLIYFEFLRTKFKYGEETIDMSGAQYALAILPMHEFWRHYRDPTRVVLNGWVLRFCEFMLETKLLDVNGAPGPLGSLSPQVDVHGNGPLVCFQQYLRKNFERTTVLEDTKQILGLSTQGNLGHRQYVDLLRYKVASPPPDP